MLLVRSCGVFIGVKAVVLGGDIFPQPRSQLSEMVFRVCFDVFSTCVDARQRGAAGGGGWRGAGVSSPLTSLPKTNITLLLSHAGKVVLKIVTDRLSNNCDTHNILLEEQRGFQPG